MPIGTVAQLEDATIPYRLPRYNFYPAAEVQGVAAPGVATGTALHRMEELAQRVLPPGIGFEWTEIAYQQEQKGTPTVLVFGAAARRMRVIATPAHDDMSCQHRMHRRLLCLPYKPGLGAPRRGGQR